ncbi:hypothetical protein BCEN4_320019 [Burkholderia cenocepacia]|nr:hypothetical protein BCEN4_320019 [Burkholderia cenocepacia]
MMSWDTRQRVVVYAHKVRAGNGFMETRERRLARLMSREGCLGRRKERGDRGALRVGLCA